VSGTNVVFLLRVLTALQDAFFDNLLLDWLPESLHGVTACKPRVYLIDFEFAAMFSPDLSRHECVTRIPLGGSCLDLKYYTRPIPAKLESTGWFNAFELDVWQLGQRFADITVR
jgi:hypothetical protein